MRVGEIENEEQNVMKEDWRRDVYTEICTHTHALDTHTRTGFGPQLSAF